MIYIFHVLIQKILVMGSTYVVLKSPGAGKTALVFGV